MNKVNGEQALDFARTRKAFANGDRQRGINQQAVIEAAIRKATSKAIITKYTSLLKSVDGKYQTNMEYKKMTQLIKMQLNDMSPWNITSYSLSGTDSSNYTYTYNQLLYVMEPDENSITEAKELIKEILNNEKLDNSYTDIGGTSNTVYKNKNTTVETPKKQVETKKDNNTLSTEEKKEEKEIVQEKKEEIDKKDNNINDEKKDDDDPLSTITPTPNDDKTVEEEKSNEEKSNEENSNIENNNDNSNDSTLENDKITDE